MKKLFAALMAVFFMLTVTACTNSNGPTSLYPERGGLSTLWTETSDEQVSCRKDLQQISTNPAGTVSVDTMTVTSMWDKETVTIAVSEDKVYKPVAGFVAGKNGGAEIFLVPHNVKEFVLNAKTDFSPVAPFKDVVLCVQGEA